MRTPTQEEIDLVARLFKTLPPFSITITDPDEAATLINAILYYIGCGTHGGDLVSAALVVSCRLHGKDKGVDEWIKRVNSIAAESGKTQFPKFMKPLMLHFINHIKQEFDNKAAEQQPPDNPKAKA